MSNYSQSYYDDQDKNSSWYKILNLVSDNSTFLDVGCSSGNFGQQLIKRKQAIVDGIEIDDSDYKKAKAKLRNVYKLNIETNPLDAIKNKYDYIYFGDVIEHLVNPAGTLKRIKPLLSVKGKVLFSIPNMAHVAVRLPLLKGDFDYSETGLLDKTHLHFYNLNEVYRVFREAGYEVDHMDFVEKDYPKPVIQEWLDSLGLKADNVFYDLMRQPEAAAFQFVGSAKPVAKPIAVKRQKFGPIDLYSAYHTATLKHLRDELTAAIEHRDNIIDEKNHELKMIKASRFWKLRNMVAKLVGKKVIN